MKTATREKLKYFLTGILPVLCWVLLYVLVFMFSSIDANMRMPVVATLYLSITVIVCIMAISGSQPKYPVFWLGPLLFVSFFMAEDMCWPAALLWHKQYAVIITLEVILLLFFGITIMRSTGLKPGVFRALFTNKSEPLFYKIAAVPVVALGIFLCWRAIDKFVCTGIYQWPGKKVHLTAEVTSSSFVKGKYFYHRYWNMQFVNGQREKFWVYAAANTEHGYKCSTHHDPAPGSILYISGRQNWLGLAYESVDSIRAKNGERICPAR